MRTEVETRALIVLRGFFGIVYLSNGLAKVFDINFFSIWIWRTNLISLKGARGFLASDAHTSIPLYHDLAFNVILAHWEIFGPMITAAEILVGLGLMTGVLGRLAAVGGVMLALNLFVATLGTGGWAFDNLLELVPLACLALIKVPGLPLARILRQAPATG